MLGAGKRASQLRPKCESYASSLRSSFRCSLWANNLSKWPKYLPSGRGQDYKQITVRGPCTRRCCRRPFVGEFFAMRRGCRLSCWEHWKSCLRTILQNGGGCCCSVVDISLLGTQRTASRGFHRDREFSDQQAHSVKNCWRRDNFPLGQCCFVLKSCWLSTGWNLLRAQADCSHDYPCRCTSAS